MQYETTNLIKSDKQENKSVVVVKNGGVREGSGRPKGSMNKDTREKKEAMAQFKDRVKRSIRKLMNSQFNLAEGCQFLFKIETKKWKDKNGAWKEERKKPKVVDNQQEIEEYLAGDYEYDDDVYYFITTNKPDNKAIDSLLDRTFGKAAQSMDLTTGGDKIKFNLDENIKYKIDNAISRIRENTNEQE